MDGTDPHRIGVVLADAQPLYRLGAGAAIRRAPDLRLLASVGDGAAALAAAHALRPRVVLLGADLARPGAEAVLNALARDLEAVRVVLVAADTAGGDAFAAFRAGAAGYLLRTATEGELHDAIRRVARGAAVLAPEVQAGVVREIRLHHRPERPLLSVREREVLALMAGGAGNVTIARELFVSVATVRTHVCHIREKLEARDRAMAVAEGIRRGVIE